MFRDLYFSVRLETLLKQLGIRGLNRTLYWKQDPTETDLAWVKEKIELVRANKSPAAGRRPEPDVNRWFAAYLASQR